MHDPRQSQRVVRADSVKNALLEDVEARMQVQSRFDLGGCVMTGLAYLVALADLISISSAFTP
jgi:hypothetical protein